LDAQWFDQLPAKIRQKRKLTFHLGAIYNTNLLTDFSREEQVLLAGRCDTVILDSADEALYRFGRTNNRSAATLDRRRSAFPYHRRLSTGSIDSMDSVEMAESLRWMDGEDDLDLSLPSYHVAPRPSPIRPEFDSRRPSRRRTLSISSKPFSRTSSSSQGMQTARSTYVPRHSAKLSTSTIDHNATHYQDPEARLKLRVYLASPQKFDEAIEFGFPSVDGQSSKEAWNASRPRTASGSKRSDSHDHQTFLNHDTASLFDESDDVDDAASIPDIDGPITPREIDGYFRSPHVTQGSKPNSTDSSNLPASSIRTRKDTFDPYVHALAGNREMTLRMTLTRPDLRADESALYGWQGRPKNDPLALEDLPQISEDNATALGPFGGPDGWGNLPKDSVVKRLWRKVKSGGSKWP
jgi:hypothetical protein